MDKEILVERRDQGQRLCLTTTFLFAFCAVTLTIALMEGAGLILVWNYSQGLGGRIDTLHDQFINVAVDNSDGKSGSVEKRSYPYRPTYPPTPKCKCPPGRPGPAGPPGKVAQTGHTAIAVRYGLTLLSTPIALTKMLPIYSEIYFVCRMMN